MADGLVDGEIEKLIAVIAQILLGDAAGLQAIGADEFAGLELADHEVVAKGIEGIDVQAIAVGDGKAFLQFQIENEITEALAFAKVVIGARQADAEQRCSD